MIPAINMKDIFGNCSHISCFAVALTALIAACSSDNPDFSGYPSTFIENEHVKMQVFPPDVKKGLYRSTRFDWSGVIMSATYKGHEYFGYWKPTHDPYFHEDLAGPVEGYITSGPGYDEAAPGEGYVRIGVGVVKKKDEPAYLWSGSYEILEHGSWKTEQGNDWIKFVHMLETDFGYSYVYMKKIRLKDDGFFIEHTLKNTGEKPMKTDQFNHNFFMIDGEESGPAFEISFPFEVSSDDDLKGLYVLEGNKLTIPRPMGLDSLFVKLKGFGTNVSDHRITVLNIKSRAGVTFSVDRPMYDLGFWSCASTLSPENSIWISVKPEQEERWTSEYSFFIESTKCGKENDKL